ncbi:hypothetical protein WMY93_002075 [Mugilogobius chulae]|uniref:Uncharacterized protein n=1 Tax=Mugilogobius chulae TaxID=88201 RepID=A0AAW0PVQ9_9GOBI
METSGRQRKSTPKPRCLRCRLETHNAEDQRGIPADEIRLSGQGSVNFRAMYTLLNGILKQLDLRDITVTFSNASPEESAPEPGRDEEQQPWGREEEASSRERREGQVRGREEEEQPGEVKTCRGKLSPQSRVKELPRY